MELSDVVAHAARFDDLLYLATVSSSGAPHVVPLSGGWLDDRLYVSVSPSGRLATNIAHEPRCCIHYQVGESSGWDSLMVWGEGTILDSVEDKRRLWHGVLPYELDDWDDGGPAGAENTVFVEIRPIRALLLRRFGLDGRAEWRA